MTATNNNSSGSMSKTRQLVLIAMLGAVATVLMLLEFPLPFALPFYKLDFSEVPVLIGSFALGPIQGAAIELVKILINLLINGTDTMFVGEFANFLIGCSLVVPAGIVYGLNKNRKNAAIGMLLGTICMGLVGVFMNAYVLLPVYGKAFHIDMDGFVAMGQAIFPSIDSVMKLCWMTVLPFNLLKGAIVSVITLLLYKHISRLLKGSYKKK